MHFFANGGGGPEVSINVSNSKYFISRKSRKKIFGMIGWLRRQCGCSEKTSVPIDGIGVPVMP